jgi:hypothetical protein
MMAWNRGTVVARVATLSGALLGAVLLSCTTAQVASTPASVRPPDGVSRPAELPVDFSVEGPLKFAPRPTTAQITAADLMTRLYIFADDSMLGATTAP